MNDNDELPKIPFRQLFAFFQLKWFIPFHFDLIPFASDLFPFTRSLFPFAITLFPFNHVLFPSTHFLPQKYPRTTVTRGMRPLVTVILSGVRDFLWFIPFHFDLFPLVTVLFPFATTLFPFNRCLIPFTHFLPLIYLLAHSQRTVVDIE